MKYLKIFEDYSKKMYKRCSELTATILNDPEKITNRDINIVTNVGKKHGYKCVCTIQKVDSSNKNLPILFRYNYDSHEKYEGCVSSLEFTKSTFFITKKKLSCLLVKLSDDYYTLRVSNVYVKCDGVDGLIECISDMFNNRINAEWDSSDPYCVPLEEEEEEEEEEEDPDIDDEYLEDEEY